MKRYLIKFAYDGTRFEAFVSHTGKRTVEGTILKRLRSAKVIQNPEWNHYKSASRTDKWVSALGSVIAFDTNKNMQETMDALSGMSGIWVWGIANVESGFNPVRAKSRWYRYYLPSRDSMNTASDIQRLGRVFIGTHNFLGYSTLRDQRRPIRTIFDFKASPIDGFVVIDILGESFLYNQIRRMVGAILDIMDGKKKEAYLKEMLKGHIDKAKAIAQEKLIDPDGLVLMDVSHEGVKVIPWKSSIVRCFADIEAERDREAQDKHPDKDQNKHKNKHPNANPTIADLFCSMFDRETLALKPVPCAFDR